MLKPLKPTNPFTDIDEDGEIVEQTAVTPAVKAGVAVAVVQPNTGNPLKDLENAINFGFTDGQTLKVDKAGFQPSKTTNVGNILVMEVLGWKRKWLVAPGTDNAPKDLVAYSDDGVNCNDPEKGTLQEHLALLHSMKYKDAKISERVVLFGVYLASEKPFPSGMESPEYVQVDMASTSALSWASYMDLLMPSIRRGNVPVDKANIVRLTINIAENKKRGAATYPVVAFSNPYRVKPTQVDNSRLLLGC